MKKVFVLLIIMGLLLSFILPVHAEGPVEKLTRGAVNVVASPLELPKAVWEDWRLGTVKGIVSGLVWGPLVGTFNVVKRAVVGVYEIATFPLPIPADYKPILEDPDFF